MQHNLLAVQTTAIRNCSFVPPFLSWVDFFKSVGVVVRVVAKRSIAWILHYLLQAIAAPIKATRFGDGRLSWCMGGNKDAAIDVVRTAPKERLIICSLSWE